MLPFFTVKQRAPTVGCFRRHSSSQTNGTIGTTAPTGRTVGQKHECPTVPGGATFLLIHPEMCCSTEFNQPMYPGERRGRGQEFKVETTLNNRSREEGRERGKH